MHLVYENTKEEIIAIKKTPVHRPPHLHNALEIVYVTEGCVELGVGEELFHMNQGDIGFIFPNIIHHYQVFSCQRNQAIYLNASPFLVDRFTDILENKAPKPPVIKASSIEPDVYHAFNSISRRTKRTTLHWSRRICRLYWQDVSQNFSWLRRSLSEART